MSAPTAPHIVDYLAAIDAYVQGGDKAALDAARAVFISHYPEATVQSPTARLVLDFLSWLDSAGVALCLHAGWGYYKSGTAPDVIARMFVEDREARR